MEQATDNKLNQVISSNRRELKLLFVLHGDDDAKKLPSHKNNYNYLHN